MKRNKLFILIAFVGLSILISCGDDFLTVESTEKLQSDGSATEASILSSLGATYQILLFDSYANQNYNSIVLVSDLRSDDIYKGGGDAGDQGQLYKLSQFQVSPTENLDGLWSILYSGIARANNTLIACNNATGVTTEKLEQYKAEAHFLRAYYYHWLWKLWGNVPYFDKPLTAPYMAKQITADQLYIKIMEDVNFAATDGKLPMKTTGPDLGRVSQATAIMLKSRVVMYQKDNTKYNEVVADLAKVINADYELFADFDKMWNDENEFCVESIFESNQIPEGKTWGSGWQGYGTNLPAFISPNGLDDPAKIFKGGWGFGPVRVAATEIYELGDKRKNGSINDWTGVTYTPRYQNTGYFLRKYAARVGYNDLPGDQDLNYANNVRIFRYAEALLNYADLIVIGGATETAGVSAQTCLDRIRKRAFGTDNSIPATIENIKKERRREFLGEGIRFWDIVRWGDTNLLNDNDELSNRTWKQSQKYLPIPDSEIQKTKGTEFELTQNPY